MRQLFKVLIIVYSAIAICLIGLLVFFLLTGGIKTSNFSIGGSLKLVNVQKTNLEGINSLKINYKSEDVVIYASDNDELILKEYMSFTPKEEDLTNITKSGKELRLENKRNGWNGWFLGFNKSSRMEIYLPSDYKDNIYLSTVSGNIESELELLVKDFVAASSSGDIAFHEVTGEDITIRSTSGSLSIDKAEGNRKLSTSSGDIKVYGGSGNTEVSSTSGSIYVESALGDFKAGTSSGDIKVEGTIGRKDIHSTSGEIILENSEGYIKASTSSGDIKIRNTNGAGDFHSTSGLIDVEFSKDASSLTDDINAETSSGDIIISVPASLTFEFHANTSSGDISFFNDTISYSKNNRKATATVGRSPSTQLTTETTSGDIKIKNR